jgi:hypothetical protein
LEGSRCGKAEEGSGKKGGDFRQFASKKALIRQGLSAEKFAIKKLGPTGGGIYSKAMRQQEPRWTELKDSQTQPTKKKAYQKPAFRYERVFETLALRCGKLPGGGPRCITVRKTS